MYNSISVDRSLFFINESRVDSYKKIAAELSNHFTLNSSGAISNEDVWTTSFNLWLLCHPEDVLIMESAEKSFYYAPNYIIYNFLKNDYYFNFIRNHPNRSNELYFIFSVLLTNHLNEYWYELLIGSHLHEIPDRNLTRSYFDAHHATGLELTQFLEDQSRFLKVLMTNIKNTDTLANLVKEACFEALKQYDLLFVNKPIEQ